LLTWDDHEVANDYFGDESYEQSGADFLARRAAAYRAYYEHMPVPRAALPDAAHMRLYTQRSFGNLLSLHMLDSRQYRWPLACRDQDGGANCADLWNESRSKLGNEQEAWLRQGLVTNRARWTLLAQGTPMAHVDQDPGPGTSYRRDSWDGYPTARQRLLDALAQTKPQNPVVIDGDIHAFQIANLNARANDVSTPVIASELTTTSITSGGGGPRNWESRRAANPNLLFSDGSKRGYTLIDVDSERLRADLVTVESIRQATSARGVAASFVVENGRPGPIRA
jgi:alkaline phosphatase D